MQGDDYTVYIYTVNCTIHNLYIFPHTLCGFYMISELTAIISQCSIIRYVFVMEVGFCEAGLEFLNAGHMKFMLQRLQM